MTEDAAVVEAATPAKAAREEVERAAGLGKSTKQVVDAGGGEAVEAAPSSEETAEATGRR